MRKLLMREMRGCVGGISIRIINKTETKTEPLVFQHSAAGLTASNGEMNSRRGGVNDYPSRFRKFF
jgi:hypothetical protein